MKIVPVILSGGFGTRLWPLSRKLMPKQFLHDLFDKNTLFAKALTLVSNKDLFLDPIAVTHKDHKFFASDEFKSVGRNAKEIILEPTAKNTAIAIILAALRARELYKDDNVTLLVLSSDHLIEPRDAFESSIRHGLEVVDSKIVTFGIKPSFPATGYGYIKRKATLSEHCFEVEKFVEKPDENTAQHYIDDGNYNWNAGIFLFNANKYLEESAKHLPKHLKAAKSAIELASHTNNFLEISEVSYENIEEVSVDYGILEVSDSVATTEMQSRWNDVGDFKAIYDVKKKDKEGNVSEGKVELYDTKNSYIHSCQSLVTCLGVENIVAVETEDAFLIADKDRVQDVKKVVKNLQSKDKKEVEQHFKGYRPWGNYETISLGEGFKVKRILVKPHSSLSLQLHNYRSEHWVVIKGVATIQKEEEVFELKAGESTFIPVKAKHRISNNTDVDVEIIEVQMGSYVEEDDIVRLEDNYGRS